MCAIYSKSGGEFCCEPMDICVEEVVSEFIFWPIPAAVVSTPLPHVFKHDRSTSQQTNSVSTQLPYSPPLVIVAHHQPKSPSRMYGASLQFGPILLISPSYRYHLERRPKWGVYSKTVCRKPGDTCTQDRKPVLDTGPTPVRPFFLTIYTF